MTIKLHYENIIPNQKQIDDLYNLLLEREFSISHHTIPTKEEHEKFVINFPYLAWYIIRKGNDLCGSVYIQNDNSIGINFNKLTLEDVEDIISFIKANHKPLNAIKSVRRGEFLINVPSNNEELIVILHQLKKKEIQKTFIL